jgi:hypothetical protein
VKEKVDSIEQAERRREAELQLVGENEPLSGPDVPRSSSSKSIRITARSSYDASPGSPKAAAGKVLASTLPQTSAQGTRNRPTSTSSVRSAGSGHHHGGVRHRKASRATIEEETRAKKRPEDLYELMCDDMPIPNEMTLAAVKKFKWKGGGELVMEYRRRRIRA